MSFQAQGRFGCWGPIGIRILGRRLQPGRLWPSRGPTAPGVCSDAASALRPDWTSYVRVQRGASQGLGKTVTGLALVLKSHGCLPAAPAGASVTRAPPFEGRPAAFYTLSRPAAAAAASSTPLHARPGRRAALRSAHSAGAPPPGAAIGTGDSGEGASRRSSAASSRSAVGGAPGAAAGEGMQAGGAGDGALPAAGCFAAGAKSWAAAASAASRAGPAAAGAARSAPCAAPGAPGPPSAAALDAAPQRAGGAGAAAACSEPAAAAPSSAEGSVGPLPVRHPPCCGLQGTKFMPLACVGSGSRASTGRQLPAHGPSPACTAADGAEPSASSSGGDEGGAGRDSDSSWGGERRRGSATWKAPGGGEKKRRRGSAGSKHACALAGRAHARAAGVTGAGAQGCAEPRTWVACDLCDKWRVLPVGHLVRTVALHAGSVFGEKASM